MLTSALNLVFPPQCLNCDIRVPTHGTLCLGCWQQVSFITDPLCDCCGFPFDYEIDSAALCAVCLREKPPYARCRSAFRYDEHSSRLITRFKYSDHTQLSAIYGAWLANAGSLIVAESDLIVPVPLHYWRFVSRSFNQSALLARSLAAKTSLKCLPDALTRTRRTTPQTGLTRSQREKNVKGAFRINPRYTKSIKGKNILLIDDVMTTGSTIEQCTKALLKAGALKVNVLTLARTMR